MEDGKIVQGNMREALVEWEGLNKQRGTVWRGRCGSTSAMAILLGGSPGIRDLIDRQNYRINMGFFLKGETFCHYQHVIIS